jgi:hypothetical protein
MYTPYRAPSNASISIPTRPAFGSARAGDRAARDPGSCDAVPSALAIAPI